jgi:hypothetical protein
VARDLLENTITAFSASGGVTGNIVSGGVISSIPSLSSVGKILTGKAANGVAFNFTAGVGDGGDSFSVVPASGKRGVDINKVVASNVGEIRAGGGGAGAVGGSISNVTLLADTDGFVIQAGEGGAGVGSGRGGAGGGLNTIIVNGLQNTAVDPTANSVTRISAGAGGTSGQGTGGAGGLVSKVNFGYEAFGKGFIKSATPLKDQVLIEGGVGGAGRTGGAGGAVKDAFVFGAPTHEGGTSGNIVVKGGVGGDSIVSGGVAGAGGSVSGVNIQNPGTSTASKSSVMQVLGGNSGAVVAESSGGAGGSVTGVFMVGFNADINAGNGGSGIKAGLGGSVGKVSIEAGFAGVFAQSVEVDAGRGGDASGASGGSGGKVDGLKVVDADLALFKVNQGVGAGDGGNGLKGAGGVGGSVGNLDVLDLAGELGGGNSGSIQIRAGRGGDGGNTGVAGNGGKGGEVFGVNKFTTDDLNLVLAAGAGGAAKSSGAGGAGGAVSKVSFVGAGVVGGLDATASISAGTGGLGALKGAGGVGGAVTSVNALTPGKVTLSAGSGGTGGTGGGGAGAGGAVGSSKSGASLLLVSAKDSVEVSAGAAGVSGGKSAAGGAVTNVVAYAKLNLQIQGGAGSLGGKGGNLSGLGFFGVDSQGSPAFTSAPTGNVTLTAGNGSASGNVAGAGGDILTVTGRIGEGLLQKIAAGQGGGSGAASANGGNVTRLTILGGGGASAKLTVAAGDAGDAASGKTGGKGGSVSNVIASALLSGTKFLNIVAGDGGDAGAVKGRGGLGGSVTDVHVQSDIGIRSGVVFGYETMGGIFAGAGGVAAAGTPGLSGSVDDVNANAIAAIAAGKLAQGSVLQERNLATKVSKIVLNGTQFSKTDATGSFTNFSDANILGAVVNPVGANANLFKFDDIGAAGFGVDDMITAITDGFVAALNFDQKTMGVSPEAVLRKEADGVIKLTDLNQRPS